MSIEKDWNLKKMVSGLLTDTPHSEKDRFFLDLEGINLRRLKILGVALIVYFSLNLIIDVAVFIPRGKGFYLAYDIVLLLVSAAALALFFRASDGVLRRLLMKLALLFVLSWGAVLSVVQGSGITYVLILFVIAAVYYQRWYWSLTLYIFGSVLYLILLRVQKPESFSFVVVLEMVGAGVWSWMLSRILYRAHVKDFESHVEIQRITLDQQKEIDERTAELREKLDEREILLEEINHRVKNNLQILGRLLSMSLRTAPAEAEQALRESMNRIRSMYTVHEMLYGSENLSSLELGSYLTRLSAEVLHSLKGEIVIELQAESEPCTANVDAAINIGLLLTELVTETALQAFDGETGKKQMQLTIRRRRDGSLRIALEDNGRGGRRLPAAEDPENQELAPLLIHALVGQLEGVIRIESPLDDGGGSRTVLEIPHRMIRPDASRGKSAVPAE